MRLNLGCGVYPFPYIRDAVPNPVWNEPLPDEAFEPGWVNVDKHLAPGVNEKIDLFKFPWVRSSNGSPFNDDTFDYIWAAHIIEHIPHVVSVAPGLPGALSTQYRTMTEDLDGFFCFFAECWRVLKPDGLMHIRFPYGASYQALSDPTHTRYLTPLSFSYLAAKEATTPFDYNVPCHFEVDGPYDFRLQGHWRTDLLIYSEEHRETLMRENYNAVNEVRLTLRAVKG